MKKFILILTLGLISTMNILAQGLPSMGGGSGADTSSKNFRFVPLPYINFDRSLGFSIGAIPMAMYKVNPNDTVSPASISGLFGMYTSNESWFTMFFQQFYLAEDDWRITAAGGLGSINFQFFLEAPINGFIDYNTQANFVYLAAQRRIVNRLYGGVKYIYMDFRTAFGEVPQEALSELHGTGLTITQDNRDDIYYPTKGYYSNADWTTYPELFGNEFVSNKVELDWNHFFPVKKKRDVIAARAYAGLGIGDLSFQQQFIVGQSDIRGYSQGKYRGNYLYAIQGEYRWNPHKKIGAIGFFGLATVYESINESDDGKILPGIGAGFRYLVIPEYKMRAGFDVAVGQDDWGFYFRIGEAF